MPNAIITGGAGFIASHLAEALAKDYNKIFLVDNLVRTGNTRNIDHLLQNPKFEFLNLDISNARDIAKLSNIHEDEGIDVVYHLAATRINRCAQNPYEGHRFLADGGYYIVEFCAANKIKMFFASTASVYNNPKRFPIEETDPCESHTIYGAAKYYTEGLMRSFAKNFGLQYSICRFFSVYGVRMDCEGAYTEIIFNWLNNINKGNNKVTVFGNPDEKVLDLVYVKDVVGAIIAATEEWKNEVYNVSTETGVTITDLIKTISETLEVKLEVEVKPENRTDIEKKRVGSVSKLKSLGWKPKYDLAKGIKETYKWINHLNNIKQ
jgi:UDP-glucose 4-epimerase